MATPLIPQEIYLLERYTSLEYFGKMRDAWRNMLDHTESLLSRFMNNLPADYRRRPQPEQPDIVWGEHVLVNFRATMQLLDDAYINLSHGDLEALGRSSGVTGDRRGQVDFWSGWMDEVEPGAEKKYYELLGIANRYAKPIGITSNGLWSPGDLTKNYSAIIGEPINPPSTWPTYRLNLQVTVKSGDRVPQTGIYLPDVDHSFPTLLLKSDDDMAGEANEAAIEPPTGDSGYAPTIWTLVERTADTSNISSSTMAESEPLRAKAGEPCPKAGFWASQDINVTERSYKVGETMADLRSAYGLTVWQWIRDSNS